MRYLLTVLLVAAVCLVISTVSLSGALAVTGVLVAEEAASRLVS